MLISNYLVNVMAAAHDATRILSFVFGFTFLFMAFPLMSMAYCENNDFNSKERKAINRVTFAIGVCFIASIVIFILSASPK